MPHRLRATSQATPPGCEPSCRYLLDENDNIVVVNAGWDAFALAK